MNYFQLPKRREEVQKKMFPIWELWAMVSLFFMMAIYVGVGVGKNQSGYERYSHATSQESHLSKQIGHSPTSKRIVIGY